MSKVWVLQHIECETLGTIANSLQSAGISAQHIRTFEGQSVPKKMGDAAGLIVMGGPMVVYEQDRHPFLRQEIGLIDQALRGEKPVLGICLGSQLLAAALGARVTKGKKKEIGWHGVTLKEAAKSDPLWMGVEPSFIAYHWHGDIFELPSGAVSLGSSELTKCQVFRYGHHAYGFLFHIEITEMMIKEMVKTLRDELQEAAIDGREMIEKAKEHLPRLQRVGGLVFQRLANLVESRSKKA